jgi:hypothetical protein
MHEHNQQFATGNWPKHPDSVDALPGISTSGRPRFSRLQLRGSAGIAPASLSSPQGKDAQTEGHFKELEAKNAKYVV